MSARRAGLAMAGGTLLSRITGLLRTTALAAALGVTAQADAYNIANTVPTILLVLVTGGTLSAVLVPLLAETDDLDERRRRAESLGALILAVTLSTGLVAALSSPLVARMFAAGSIGQPGHDELVRQTTLFLVLFAPQVAAYGLSVHAVAVLNAAGRLALGAYASVATNVLTLLAVLVYVQTRPAQGPPPTTSLVILGLGTTAGVVAMTVLQLWGARRVLPGLRVLRRPRRDDTTDRVLRLGRWTVLYVIANQVGLAAVLTVAAGVAGGASSYQWAFAVMQLPYAIVAVSVLSAVYPRVTRAARDDLTAYAQLIATTLRLLAVVLLPSALLLFVLARPVTELLLGYGAVGDAGVEVIARGVAVFAVALLPFSAFQLLTRACYARGDARSPAVVNLAVNVVTLTGAAGAALVVQAGALERITALTAGYAASYVVGCLLLTLRLRRIAPTVLAGVPRTLGLLLVPAGLTVATGYAVLRGLEAVAGLTGLTASLAEVVLTSAVCLVVYAGAVLLLGDRVLFGLRSTAQTGRG